MQPDPNPLDAVRLRRLNELLDRGLSQPTESRLAWLDGLTEVDDAMRLRLRELLQRAQATTDDFLARSAWAAGEEMRTVLDQPGDHIGPYRLISLLGEGGMSTVWLAARDDGELRRQVALKLPLGGAASGLARRLALERDILATLEHPHIARLYEAGVAANGRPWLAMERVEGQPIDTYCRQQALDVRARLLLLLQVADAVSHAHARLVVHRDLKPANILVTPQGEVRLLDFGIAKLLEDDADDHSLTRTIGRAVTPDYAAPEQLEGRPVGVATDVYSLGVVAYELLAGKPPYRLTGAALLQPAATLRELHIVPASEAAQPDRARARQLAGDLDTILAKALKADSAERYASVEALAADLHRHLDGLPVLARPDSWRYRSRKFLGRHRGAVLAGALVAGALIAGSAGTLWQARRAEAEARTAAAERDAARRELRFANGAESFLRYLLSEGADRPLTTTELLARAEQRVDRLYAEDPALRARLQLAMGGLLEELDRFEAAERVLRSALAAARADGHDVAIAAAACQLGGVRAMLQQLTDAQALVAEGLARLRAMRAGATETDAWVICHGEQATLELRLARWTQGRALAQEVLARSGPDQASRWAYRIKAHTAVAAAHSAEGRLADAVQQLSQARDEIHRLGMERTTAAIASLGNLPVLQWRAGQLTDAAAGFEDAMRAVKSAGREVETTQQYNLARLLVDLGRSDEALRLVQAAAREISRKNDPLSSAFVMLTEAIVHCDRRDHGRCAAMLDEAERRLQGVRPPGHSVFATVRVWRALDAEARGDLARAREGLAEAVQGFDAARDRSYGIVKALAALARVDLARGDLEAARSAAQRAEQEARTFAKGFAHSELLGAALLARAQVHRAEGQTGAAQAQAQLAWEQLLRSCGADAPLSRQAKALLPPASRS